MSALMSAFSTREAAMDAFIHQLQTPPTVLSTAQARQRVTGHNVRDLPVQWSASR
jgi:hypothetical protein